MAKWPQHHSKPYNNTNVAKDGQSVRRAARHAGVAEGRLLKWRLLRWAFGRRYTILDAPGHKNYVPDMIQGAAQADIGVLVISARKGEFETGYERGGQTREHAQLAKTLGVAKLVIVVNKVRPATCCCCLWL